MRANWFARKNFAILLMTYFWIVIFFYDSDRQFTCNCGSSARTHTARENYDNMMKEKRSGPTDHTLRFSYQEKKLTERKKGREREFNMTNIQTA